MESDLKVSGNEAQQWEREMDPSSILNSWLDSRGKVSTFQFSLSLELMLFTRTHISFAIISSDILLEKEVTFSVFLEERLLKFKIGSW